MTSPGGSVGALFVEVRPGLDRFGNELNKGVSQAGTRAVDNAGPGMGSRLAKNIAKGIAAGAGILAVGLAKGLTVAVKQASDLNETVSKTNTVFGKAGKSVQQWSKNMASDFGISQRAALDAATTFAIYGKSAGKAGDDLFNFSTDLTGLAADMASFSNTSPEEAIEAIGAAMRGESDPIEKYGVLLNESVLKNRAFKMGLIDTTKNALTPQQRVLAVNAELFAQLGSKGSKTLGDFERTSKGLANQQRIAKAEVANFSAEIGQSLLPVVTRIVTKFNTEWLPALRVLWREYGPGIVAWAVTATDRFSAWASSLDRADVAGWLAQARSAFAQAAPVVSEFFRNFKEGGSEGLADTLKVSGIAMGFLADHADKLGKVIPYVIAGLVAYKVAQIAANVATALGPALGIAQILTNRRLAASQVALTAALSSSTAALAANTGVTVANTVAENTGTVSRWRAVGAWIAQVPAMIAARAATIAGTVAQWAHNAAWLAFPGTWIIAAIIAVVAAVVLLYKKNETFRNFINASWAFIKKAIGATVEWFVNTAWPSLKRAYDQLAAMVMVYVKIYRGAWNAVRSVSSTVIDAVTGYYNNLKRYITQTLPNAFKSGVATISKWWNNLKEAAAKPVRFVINTVFNKMSGVFNKVADFIHLPKNLRAPTFSAGFARGGRIHGAPSNVDNRVARGPGGEPIGLAGGEYIVNARSTRKALPLLESINRGFAFGGFLDFLKGPGEWVKSKVGGVVNDIRGQAGDGMFGQMLTGMGRTVLNGLVERAKGLLGSMFGGGGSGTFGKWPRSPSAQRGDSGVWRAVVALIRSTGPLSGSFGNGYRPGDPLWHGSGRAVDWMGANQDALASFLATRRPLELIHRTNERDYAYTRGVNKGSFNERLMEAHRNHVHIAMDDGGFRWLQPGMNMIPNGTGKPELIGGPKAMRSMANGVTFNFHGPVASRQAAKSMVLEAYNELVRERKIR